MDVGSGGEGVCGGGYMMVMVHVERDGDVV